MTNDIADVELHPRPDAPTTKKSQFVDTAAEKIGGARRASASCFPPLGRALSRSQALKGLPLAGADRAFFVPIRNEVPCCQMVQTGNQGNTGWLGARGHDSDTSVVARGEDLGKGSRMLTRERTLTVMLTEEERRRAHALADAGDESIGRWLRRVVNGEYERRFGDAPAPAATARVGSPKEINPSAKTRARR